MGKTLSKKQKLNKFACRLASRNPQVLEEAWLEMDDWYNYWDGYDGWYSDDVVQRVDHQVGDCSFTIWVYKGCVIEELLENEWMYW